MRELDVLDEAESLDTVRMQEHEFRNLGRDNDALFQFPGAQRTVHDGHGQNLALVVAEHEAVAAGETRLHGRSHVLTDDLALRDLDFAYGHAEAEFLRGKGKLGRAAPQFAHKGMVGAALHGISHAQEEALISAGKHLKAHGSVLRPVAGKLKGMTGDVRVLRA